MTIIKQIFNPPLRLCNKNYFDVVTLNERLWYSTKDDEGLVQAIDSNYIGCMQIEEVWKHYYNEYYISNYGYVVKIKSEDATRAEALIPDTLKNAQENSEGVRWLDFSEDLKNLFRENAFVPINRKNSGCQICLNFTGNSAQYDLHKIIARFFLERPKDFDEQKYAVHHIDNNSYNNSVVNLVYLSADEHTAQHKIYHPMSHKRY